MSDKGSWSSSSSKIPAYASPSIAFRSSSRLGPREQQRNSRPGSRDRNGVWRIPCGRTGRRRSLPRHKRGPASAAQVEPASGGVSNPTKPTQRELIQTQNQKHKEENLLLAFSSPILVLSDWEDAMIRMKWCACGEQKRKPHADGELLNKEREGPQRQGVSSKHVCHKTRAPPRQHSDDSHGQFSLLCTVVTFGKDALATSWRSSACEAALGREAPSRERQRCKLAHKPIRQLQTNSSKGFLASSSPGGGVSLLPRKLWPN